ncbi:MAG: hypothetical protein C0501_30395 [Isosphaera sp.]|nr:hypothetical protein [Isosphaera sp.]
MSEQNDGLEPHPLAESLPEMTAEEYAELRDSVRDHGLKVPIKLFEGKVLDGRHRLRALRDLGVEPGPDHVEEFHGTAEQAVVMVDVWNLHRRSHSPEQKRAARAALVQRLRDSGMSTRAIADRVGVSHTTVREDLARQVETGFPPGPADRVNHPVSPAAAGSDHRVMQPASPDPADTDPDHPAVGEAPPAEAPALKVVGKDGKCYAAAGHGRAKKSDPPAERSELEQIGAAVSAVVGRVTRFLGSGPEGKRKKLEAYLSAFGYLAHTGDKFDADEYVPHKCRLVALAGLRFLVEQADLPGPARTPDQLVEKFGPAAGLWTPEHVRRKVREALEAKERRRLEKEQKRRAAQPSSGPAG